MEQDIDHNETEDRKGFPKVIPTEGEVKKA